MIRQITTLLLFLFGTTLSAQQPSVFDDDPMQHLPLGMEYSKYVIREPTGLPVVKQRVEPLHWWTNMVNPRLEVLIYDRKVAEFSEVQVEYPGVSVEYVRRLENPNYLFVGLYIAPGTSPGSFDLTLASRVRALSSQGVRESNIQAVEESNSQAVGQSNSQGVAATKTVRYELKAHPRSGWMEREALSAHDLIYLIMPDRFANGDPANDKVRGMADTLVNRQKFLFRHGGDLQGIIDKLDYLEELGVTALWLNPVLENDQPYASYHGYAVSDHYRIDRRFGSNEKYRELVKKAHERGIKVVMDVIFNHVGDQHWQIRDLPSKDWIHQWPEYTQTTYRAPTIFDPNGSEYDRKRMTDGWFDRHMPDLNQQNPHLAKYLIQNSIWWTLYSGQDAFRIDTYAYPDTEFMAEWNQRLQEEVPHLGIFGETWVHGPGVQAWFVGGSQLKQTVNTHLPGVTDFQVYYALNEALSKDPGWTEGVNRLYYTMAQDYLYPNPQRNVTFLDNHDISRVFTSVGEDMTKMKSALSLLLTIRGIPMIYYGTELGFTGAGGAFGEAGRVDFPGGFADDQRNLFSQADRNSTEQGLHGFVKRLANFRKSSLALTSGKTIQYVPQDGVYTFFRQQGEELVMVVFNGNNEARTVKDFSSFQQQLGGLTRGFDLTRNAEVSLESIELAGKETRVISLVAQ